MLATFSLKLNIFGLRQLTGKFLNKRFRIKYRKGLFTVPLKSFQIKNCTKDQNQVQREEKGFRKLVKVCRRIRGQLGTLDITQKCNKLIRSCCSCIKVMIFY